MIQRTPWVSRWGYNPDGWNIDDDDFDGEGDRSGLPGLSLVASAVACWLTAPGASSADVASVFNLPQSLADEIASTKVEEPASIDSAIQTWSLLQGGTTYLAEAAEVFRLPFDMIERLVEGHMWMFVREDLLGRYIGHDGC